MKKKNSSHIILNKAFKRLQKSNPNFSLRALALKLEVSHVFMSKILKGEANIPDDKLARLIRFLKLDDLSKRELKDAIIKDAIEQKLAPFETKEITIDEDLITPNFEELPSGILGTLENWYELAICDLLTTVPKDSHSWVSENIASELELTHQEVESGLTKLSSLNLIEKKEHGWKKTNTKLRFPTTTPKDITRNYYQQILAKAADELEDQSQDRFEKRLITNLTIAVDESKIAYAKEEIQKFTYQLSSELSKGDCQSVYFLTTCFYPVTK